MNDKERLQLEEELLMTCSKAQAINKYIDELEENSKLSELWCKSQQENKQLKNIIDELEKWLKEERKRLRKSIKPINDIRVEMIDTIEYKLQELKGTNQ